MNDFIENIPIDEPIFVPIYDFVNPSPGNFLLYGRFSERKVNQQCYKAYKRLNVRISRNLASVYCQSLLQTSPGSDHQLTRRLHDRVSVQTLTQISQSFGQRRQNWRTYRGCLVFIILLTKELFPNQQKCKSFQPLTESDKCAPT